jgi:hypothetical protein
MKKISASIPTVIRNIESKNKVKRKSNQKNEDTSSSIVIFQHNNLIEARYELLSNVVYEKN